MLHSISQENVNHENQFDQQNENLELAENPAKKEIVPSIIKSLLRCVFVLILISGSSLLVMYCLCVC